MVQQLPHQLYVEKDSECLMARDGLHRPVKDKNDKIVCLWCKKWVVDKIPDKV